MKNLIGRIRDYASNIILNDLHSIEAEFDKENNIRIKEKYMIFPCTTAMFLPRKIREERKQKAQKELTSLKEQGFNVNSVIVNYSGNRVVSIGLY